MYQKNPGKLEEYWSKLYTAPEDGIKILGDKFKQCSKI